MGPHAGNSRLRYKALIDDCARLENEAVRSPFNRYTEGPDRHLGIIACGIARNYLMEKLSGGMPPSGAGDRAVPVAAGTRARLAAECQELLIIEEGQPLVEQAVRGVLPAPLKIRGRLTGELPRTGELTPDSVRAALGLAPHRAHAASEIVVPRPPALCQGCGHRDMYTALTDQSCANSPTGRSSATSAATP